MSDLSTVLIAKTILFLKLFKLPKSRWSAIKDKVVNVPINDNDILKSISSLNSLPRKPCDAGLIPVQLKRKIEYKNVVTEAFVNPDQLIAAVNKLKEMGHPGYVDMEVNENYTLSPSDFGAVTEDASGDSVMAENVDSGAK